VETELKESDPIEKAEKDFWKIIEEEKRKRDRKTVLVRLFLTNIILLFNLHLFFREMKKPLLRLAQWLKQNSPLIQQHKWLNRIFPGLLFFFYNHFIFFFPSIKKKSFICI
jgi:hypothetical protein